ncbi:hypothetical protein CNMCM5623_007504 [Aspergillus felis]|uniref:LCCL domain-containing protein n=1 Tax=Aspergillus felis TaxID=1287682 RepID=A0A8H6PJQ0_9EURO|nr:hypothetical protein CNMCM5623_007504 [Aspergillus felis]KAF7181541.1 hypothetical protein CNMCM7691_000760 [Aspergillus felis]
MAAPAHKTTKDLNGTWIQNKKLSGSADLGLQIQGIGYFIRNIIRMAPITIQIRQYEARAESSADLTCAVTNIDIEQSAPGVSTSKEHHCLDGLSRDHSDWLFGSVINQTRWISLEDIEDKFLTSGWLPEGGNSLIYSKAASVSNGWTATQVWGFQEINGERRHCRNIVIEKEDRRAEFRFVYDWQERIDPKA